MPDSSRPRERLLTVGERSLSQAELLAITLRTGNGQENALHLAQRLLNQFRGLPGIAQASVTELTAVRGIGQVKAIEIKAALELGRRLLTTAPEERLPITSPNQAANILMPEMSHLPQEQIRTILLDTRNRVLSIPTIYIGSLNTTSIRVGEIFRPAIKENAAAIILSHNHPSGDSSPSPEDISVTRKIVQAGELLGISVLDHIIIGNQQYASLKERGAGFY
ncbi:MAG: DNA repair protein RadC [Anaerolineae bacterium]|nr:DNA repair protein RadC [Anaerolineae bacterium]